MTDKELEKLREELKKLVDKAKNDEEKKEIKRKLKELKAGKVKKIVKQATNNAKDMLDNFFGKSK